MWVTYLHTNLYLEKPILIDAIKQQRNKTEKLEVRVTKEDKEFINELCAEYKISKQTLIMQLLFDDKRFIMSMESLLVHYQK